MSSRILYKVDAGPPSCAVRIVAEMIGLKITEKDCDFFNLEHKSAQYIELNPLGTVPIMIDGDFVLSDSNSIIKYFLSKYGGELNESLFPSDFESRALIDQALFFNAGVFFIRLKAVCLETIFEDLKEPTQRQLEDIDRVYVVLEKYLQKHRYIATDTLSIADIALGCNAFALTEIHHLDQDKYPRVVAWLQALREVPEIKKYGVAGAQILITLLKELWNKNKSSSDKSV